MGEENGLTGEQKEAQRKKTFQERVSQRLSQIHNNVDSNLTRFQKVRRILYHDYAYEESNILVKGFYNANTFYRLKKIELGDDLAALGSALKNGATWVWDSSFGKAVKKAGTGVAAGGKIVGKAAVFGVKAAGSFMLEMGRKSINAVKNAAASQPVVKTARKVSGFFKAGGTWIKDKALKLASVFRKDAVKKENEPIELKTMEELAREKEEARKVEEESRKETAKEEKTKKKLFIAEAAGILWSGMKFGGRAVTSSAKAIAHSQAAGLVKTGVLEAAKKLKKAGKSAARKTAETVKYLTRQASNTYDYVMSRAADYNFASTIQQGREDREIREALRESALESLIQEDKKKKENRGEVLAEKAAKDLAAFQEEMENDPEVQAHLQLRKDVWRVNRNVEGMENGGTGDIEMAPIGTEKNDEAVLGMLSKLGYYDLAGVLTEEALAEYRKKKQVENADAPVEEKAAVEEKKNEEEKKAVEEVGLSELMQEEKKEQKEKNAANRKTGMKDQVFQKVGDVAKKGGEVVGTVKNVKGTADKVIGLAETGLGYGKKAAPGLEGLQKKVREYTGYKDDAGVFHDGIQQKADGAVSTAEHAAKGLHTTAEAFTGEFGVGKTTRAVADDLIIAQDVAKYAGENLSLTNLSKCLHDAVNISEKKEREKYIADFVANALAVAGQFAEYEAGKNSFTNLSGLFLDKDVNLVGNTEALCKVLKGNDTIDRKIQYAKTTKSGLYAMEKIFTEIGRNTPGMKTLFESGRKVLDRYVKIYENVKDYNKLEEKRARVAALAPEEISENIVDPQVLREMKDLVGTIEAGIENQKTGKVAGAIEGAAITGISLIPGAAGIAAAAENAFEYVSPAKLLMSHLAAQTDHELMMKDVFGSMEKYREYRDRHHLDSSQVEDEILKMSDMSSVAEYASRVRVEMALHLYSRAQQAQRFGISNAATNIMGAAEITGKTVKEIYKEIGGTLNYDNLTGSSKMNAYTKKLEEQKKEDALQEKKMQEKQFDDLKAQETELKKEKEAGEHKAEPKMQKH